MKVIGYLWDTQQKVLDKRIVQVPDIGTLYKGKDGAQYEVVSKASNGNGIWTVTLEKKS